MFTNLPDGTFTFDGITSKADLVDRLQDMGADEVTICAILDEVG